MPARVADGYEHARRIADLIKERVAAALPDVGSLMAQDAALRAPTIDEEYNELNAEAGSDPLVERSGDRSADTDERIRFIKPESTYLANAVLNPANVIVDEDAGTVSIGNVAFLESQTYFEYQNVIKSKGQVVDKPVYRVAPYFMMFEAGVAAFTVQPHTRRGDGGYYPLRPGEDKDGARSAMVKSISGRQMFLPIYLEAVARTALTSVMASIGPGHAS